MFKGFAPILIILGVLVISGLIVGGAYYLKPRFISKKEIPASSSSTTPAPVDQSPKFLKLSNVWGMGTLPYSNPRIDITFDYPKVFKVEETDIAQANQQYKKDYPEQSGVLYPDEVLVVGFKTPEVAPEETTNEGFDYQAYEDNSMGIGLQVSENPLHYTLDGYLKQKYSSKGIDGKAVYDSIKGDLKPTNLPVPGAYTYKGELGGESPLKAIFFTYKNKIYRFTMGGGHNTGSQYSPEAEKVFDNLISSIKLH